jgi:hypothetical protein
MNTSAFFYANHAPSMDRGYHGSTSLLDRYRAANNR